MLMSGSLANPHYRDGEHDAILVVLLLQFLSRRPQNTTWYDEVAENLVVAGPPEAGG